MADLTLPRPIFINTSPVDTEMQAIALWQEIADKPLYPSQAERLFLDVLVYVCTLLRVAIQYAAEQCLVNLAEGTALDQLGALVATTRLPASKALVTVQFTRPLALGTSQLIPAGTRVATAGGEVRFATLANATIAGGNTSITTTAECTVEGVIGNGFTAGQINTLVDPVAGVTLTASNTTTSNGGAEIEDDEGYRARIKLAPNQYSVAGSVGAYQYYAYSASQTIIDVAVLSPRRVLVRVYPLTETGLPSSEILAAVLAALDDETVRPLTDEVEVLTPVEVTYSITAAITLLSSADADLLEDQLNAAAIAYAAERRAGLGRDIVRSQIIAALSLSGVYSVSLSAPVADLVIDPEEWANCTAIAITIAGTNDG